MDGRKRFEYTRCGGIYFFENRRKKISDLFSKISGYVWTGPYAFSRRRSAKRQNVKEKV